MQYLGINYEMKHAPKLDPTFIPFGVWRAAYLKDAKQPVAIDTNLIHYRELYVTGSTRSSIAQFRKTLEFVSLGLLNVNEMITHRYELKDVLTAFENARQAKGIKHVIDF